MKKLCVAVLLIVGLTTFAQEKKSESGKARTERLSPEQRNQLRLKKLTMELGLNESQKKQLAEIIAEQSAKREAIMAERKEQREKGTELTADENFARQNKKLDDEMQLRERLVKILTPEQFTKWQEMKEDRRGQMMRSREKRTDKDLKSKPSGK